MVHKERQFTPANIVVLTVSDTRTEENDTSGSYLKQAAEEAGHTVLEKVISIDDIYKIRAVVSVWIADDNIQAVLVTGGTGFTSRDSTPEALIPLFDKHVEGFGELFRWYHTKKLEHLRFNLERLLALQITR